MKKKVKTQQQSSRKRYSNDLSQCDLCKCFYDIDTENHILNDCPVLKSKAAMVGRFPRNCKRIICSDKWKDEPVWDRLIESHTYLPP